MVFRWLRKLIRRHTSPIPLSRAEKWSKRLNYMYILLAWNAFGGVCYMMYTGRTDWAKFYGFKSPEEAMMPPAASFSKVLNIPNAKVIRIVGLEKVGEYDIEDGEIVKMERQEIEILPIQKVS